MSKVEPGIVKLAQEAAGQYVNGGWQKFNSVWTAAWAFAEEMDLPEEYDRDHQYELRSIFLWSFLERTMVMATKKMEDDHGN